MTDERLDQILKQALAPEIEDYEIQIQRKEESKKMSMKKIIAGGFIACAALTMVVTGGNVNDSVYGQDVVAGNFFAVTAYASELPEEMTSGDVIGLRMVDAGHGSLSYLDGRFTISGQNIEKIKVTTDKCELYMSVPVYEGDSDYENAVNGNINGQEGYHEVFAGEREEGAYVDHYDHLQIVGPSYEGEYNDQMYFGMSIPEELCMTSDDIKEGYYKSVDQVDGATLTIEVTYADESTEIHHYRLTTGKIFVPVDENGMNQWDNLTRFLTEEEETGETANVYGYLIEKMD